MGGVHVDVSAQCSQVEWLQLSKGFGWGPHAARAWMLTIGAFALALLDVGVQVALNHWTKEFFKRRD